MPRTAEEWTALFQTITHGYIAGSDKRKHYTSGLAMAARLESEGVLKPDDKVVDAGCGNGRLAVGLLGKGYHYIGFDIVEGCIEFCKRAFADEAPAFRFTWMDVINAHYNVTGKLQIGNTKWPVSDEWADAVVASSLFSHLGTLANASHYVAEAVRVLKSGGRFFSTWFTHPPNEVSQDEARTVFKAQDVDALLMEHGFRLMHKTGGQTTGHDDQLRILCVKHG